MARVVSVNEQDVPVLMSADNLTGWKLEELAAQLTHEMHVKSAKITPECLASEDWQVVHHNNLEIIQRLTEIQQLQVHSMDITARIFADKEAPHPDRKGS